MEGGRDGWREGGREEWERLSQSVSQSERERDKHTLFVIKTNNNSECTRENRQLKIPRTPVTIATPL